MKTDNSETVSVKPDNLRDVGVDFIINEGKAVSSKTIRDKRFLYKTARATISCARFQTGDFVSVLYFGQGSNGTHWFLASKSGKANEAVAYPEHHLTDFVL